MRIIQLSDGWHRYKQKDKKIKPGEYIQFTQRPTPELKQRLPFIPASKGPGFKWLLPIKEWILKFFGEEFELEIEPMTPPNYSSYPLRDWQKDQLDELSENISTGLPFRKGLVVPIGGGKTLFALIVSTIGKTLYVCPTHLFSTVRDEATKWKIECPVITTAESVKKYDPKDFQIMIVDECLSAKNPKAKRTKGLKRFCENLPITILMTGTPMSAKKALDLRWVNVLDEKLPSEDHFFMYNFGINPHMKEIESKGIKFLEVDDWKYEEIYNFLSNDLTIIDTSDLKKQIPPMQEIIVELPQPKLFMSTMKGLFTKKSTSKRLIQGRCCSAGFIYNDKQKVIWLEKLPEKIQWVKNFIKDNPNEPLIVAANWKAEQQKLAEELKEHNPALVFSDACSSDEVAKFTSGKTNLIIVSANITEGMNLQERARIIICLSLSTLPIKFQQLIGRIFRPGQLRTTILYNLICKGTLDRKHLELVKSHLDASEKFINQSLNKELKKLITGR